MNGLTQEQRDKLNQKLPADAIRSRNQNGMTLSYIEGHHAIRTSNEIFGADGWTRDTERMELVQTEQKKNSKGNDVWYVSYICKVRICAGGTCRDGFGFGQGIDGDLGRAHESACKEAETDAMKRALMTFGDPLGLALYDKEQRNVASQADIDREWIFDQLKAKGIEYSGDGKATILAFLSGTQQPHFTTYTDIPAAKLAERRAKLEAWLSGSVKIAVLDTHLAISAQAPAGAA